MTGYIETAAGFVGAAITQLGSCVNRKNIIVEAIATINFYGYVADMATNWHGTVVACCRISMAHFAWFELVRWLNC